MPWRRSLQDDAPFGFDFALRAGQAKSEADACAVLERAGGADGDASAADVQRQRGRDGVAEPVGDGNAEHDARASTAIEVVGKQMRRERRQNVLHRAVLIHVAGNAERGQLAHLFRARYRTAENQNRQAPVVELADAADQVDPGGVRQAQVDDQQIELREVGPHAREQLGGAFHRHGAMAGALERALEAVAHERGVVGDENGLGGRGAGGHHSTEVSLMYRNATSKALACVAELIRLSI